MYGVPATPVSCSRPKRPPATTPGTTPRRMAMKRIGSISRPNDPPCGMRNGKACAIQLRTAARAIGDPDLGDRPHPPVRRIEVQAGAHVGRGAVGVDEPVCSR